MVPSDVTWHQAKQTNGAEWRHAARKWTAQLPDKCTLLHDFVLMLMLMLILLFAEVTEHLVAHHSLDFSENFDENELEDVKMTL